jgi:Fur family transcriptional regulator, ferric uptake regulator
MTTESASLAATLHATDHRVTGQRRLLLEIIRREGEHLDAEELYRLARQQYPRLSRSTVYRTMRLLRDLGLVDEVHLGEDHHHYEIKAPAHHHHLICLGCGQVLEFSSPRAEYLAAVVAGEHGFEIREIRIDLTGYCANCRKARSAE